MPLPTQKRKRLTPPGFYTGADIQNVATPSPYFKPSPLPDVNPDFAFAPSTPQTGTAMAAQGYIPPYKTQPDLINDIYMPQFDEASRNLQAAYSAPHAGTARQIFSSLIPMSALRGFASGETQRGQRIEDAAQQYDLLNNIIASRFNVEKQPLSLETMRSNIAENYARADYLRSQSGKMETPDEARERRIGEVKQYGQHMTPQEADRYILTGQTTDPLMLATLQQKIGHENAMEYLTGRGQDVSATTTRRGQDITDIRDRQLFAERESNKMIVKRENDIKEMTELDADMQTMKRYAQQLMTHPGLKGITGIRGSFWDVPGTDAANARALLRTIATESAINSLQKMRRANVTGGALGQVSDKEEAMLSNTIAPLLDFYSGKTKMSPEMLQQSLNALVKFVDESGQRQRDAYNRMWGSAGPGAMIIGRGGRAGMFTGEGGPVQQGAPPPAATTPAAKAKKRLQYDTQGNLVQ